MKNRTAAACIASLAITAMSAGCGCTKKSSYDMNKQALDAVIKQDARVSDEIRYNEMTTEELDRLHNEAEGSASSPPEVLAPDDLQQKIENN